MDRIEFWKFINKPEGKIDQLFGNGSSYDVNAYFVPMFTGVKTAATKTAKRQALKKMDPRLIPSILFYKGKLKPYKESLDFQQKDIPYFFVLDKKGKIVYATSGRCTSEKMAKVEELVGEWFLRHSFAAQALGFLAEKESRSAFFGFQFLWYAFDIKNVE